MAETTALKWLLDDNYSDDTIRPGSCLDCPFFRREPEQSAWATCLLLGVGLVRPVPFCTDDLWAERCRIELDALERDAAETDRLRAIFNQDFRPDHRAADLAYRQGLADGAAFLDRDAADCRHKHDSHVFADGVEDEWANALEAGAKELRRLAAKEGPQPTPHDPLAALIGRLATDHRLTASPVVHACVAYWRSGSVPAGEALAALVVNLHEQLVAVQRDLHGLLQRQPSPFLLEEPRP